MFNPFKRPETTSGETKPAEASKGSAELLRFIIGHLVDYPEDVIIQEVNGEGETTIFEVKVNESDIGKVIGKKGRIIKAIRIVLRASALREGRSISVELVN